MRRRHAEILLAAAGAVWLGAAAPPPLFDSIMARLAALPDRQAGFTEDKHLSSLQQPLHGEGTLVFRHPAHIEKNTDSPRQERLVIDGDQLTIAQGGQPPRVVALDAHPALRALATTITATLAGDPGPLRRFYDVAASGTLAAWRITLRPTEPAFAQAVRAVTIDGGGADLHRLEIVQANGDTQTLTITRLK